MTNIILATQRLSADWMIGLKRPELTDHLAIIDEKHNDQPVICVVMPDISDYPSDELERIAADIVSRFNAGEPEAWADKNREIKRLKEENTILREMAVKHGEIPEGPL